MKPTTGRRVICGTRTCLNFMKEWILRPVEFKEKGKLTASGLHTWPDVRCDECGAEPIFMGYVESEDSTETPDHFCLADDCCETCRRHVTPHRGCILR